MPHRLTTSQRYLLIDAAYMLSVTVDYVGSSRAGHSCFLSLNCPYSLSPHPARNSTGGENKDLEETVNDELGTEETRHFSHLVGITTSALPRLHLLSLSIRPRRYRPGLCSHVDAESRSILHCDVIVVGDIEALCRQVIVTLPDLEILTVGAEVGTKVETVLGVGVVVGRNADGGASGVVDPLLEGEEV